MPVLSFFYSKDFVYTHKYTEAPYDFPIHSHDICELIYLKKGDVSYMVEGKVYKPSKNCLFLTHPLENHAILINSPVPYERYNILFDEKSLGSNIYHKISPQTIMMNFDSNAIILDLFKKMDYYCENFEEKELQIILTHLTEEVLYHFVLAAKKSDQSSVYTTNPLIQAAVDYIREHIHMPLTVDMICNELFISKSHLHHLFVNHLKQTPQKYILSKKLATAQRELRTGRKPTDVYSGCGFVDYSTFFRAYKKYFGHAPSEEIYMNPERTIQS